MYTLIWCWLWIEVKYPVAVQTQHIGHVMLCKVGSALPHNTPCRNAQTLQLPQTHLKHLLGEKASLWRWF